jgi:FKBP-type peptidyl-prolyl cis-trans isomerase SlyD
MTAPETDMQISQDMVVSIHYTLTDKAGETIDSSVEHGEPLAYLHGHGNIVPGLENALTGKTIGDKFDVSVEPAEGYGEHYAELVQQVPREAFEGVEHLEPGMQFQADTGMGPRLFTITEVNGDTVTVDGNHPLAGEVLNFAIEVTAVRAASEEELSHGHVHGPGGHHH